MKGLKKYSHDDRRKVIDELIPLVREKFGDNLVALAATASFARNEDCGYSDLELTAFVKELPAGERKGGVGKIRDGLLIELIWTTRQFYLEDTLEITKDWYLAGSDVLLPLINEEFINELKAYEIENRREKCLVQAAANWHEVQEATAKVLNATAANNRDALPLLLFDALRHVLIVLSFLNETPFVTFSKFISQARGFDLKPSSLDVLIETIVQGDYQNLPGLETVLKRTFSELEAIFEDSGIKLYEETFDLN